MAMQLHSRSEGICSYMAHSGQLHAIWLCYAVKPWLGQFWMYVALPLCSDLAASWASYYHWHQFKFMNSIGGTIRTGNATLHTQIPLLVFSDFKLMSELTWKIFVPTLRVELLVNFFVWKTKGIGIRYIKRALLHVAKPELNQGIGWICHKEPIFSKSAQCHCPWNFFREIINTNVFVNTTWRKQGTEIAFIIRLSLFVIFHKYSCGN